MMEHNNELTAKLLEQTEELATIKCELKFYKEKEIVNEWPRLGNIATGSKNETQQMAE
jgi:hypothetical protein